MWLTSSSIGRKFVMALTGAALVLFVTFHCLMNTVAIIWPAAYNEICMFLGANWYALIASAGLAALIIIHIVYAIWLTIQNRAARGEDRYEVTSMPPHVEWSSKNMLVLGIVILAFLGVHLIQFWAKMQLQEVIGSEATDNGVVMLPELGTLFLNQAFGFILTPIIYIIGFVALWFHMTHGFWSMFQSVGWNNGVWINRLKCIGNAWVTIVVLLFVAQALTFTLYAQAGKKADRVEAAALNQYVTDNNIDVSEMSALDIKLQYAGQLDSTYQATIAKYRNWDRLISAPACQEQYFECYEEHLTEINASFVKEVNALIAKYPDCLNDGIVFNKYVKNLFEKYDAKYDHTFNSLLVLCQNAPNMGQSETLQEAQYYWMNIIQPKLNQYSQFPPATQNNPE